MNFSENVLLCNLQKLCNKHGHWIIFAQVALFERSSFKKICKKAHSWIFFTFNLRESSPSNLQFSENLLFDRALPSEIYGRGIYFHGTGRIVIEWRRAEQEAAGGLRVLWAPNRAKSSETTGHCVIEWVQIIHCDIIFLTHKEAIIISTIW